MSNGERNEGMDASPSETPSQQMEAMRQMMQQMMQQMMNQQSASEQRFRLLEDMVQSSQRTPSETPSNTPQNASATEAETTNIAGPPHIEVVAERRRARLPNPAMFSGTIADWPSWRITIENKLAVDGLAIGSSSDQCAYIYSRLEKSAWKNMTTFMRERRLNGTPHDMLEYMERIYGDPNMRARAARRLHQLRQKDDQSFLKFLPQLERELADAGAMEWPDEAKRQILLNSLNLNMSTALVNRGVPAAYAELVQRLHEISTDIDMLNLTRSKLSQSKHTRRAKFEEEVYDPMDWAPSPTQTSVSQVKVARSSSGSASYQPEDHYLRGKRARWASNDEVEERRRKGLCLRCARSGCRVATCPLKPARRPQLQSQGVNTTATEERSRKTGGPAPKGTRIKKIERVYSSTESEESTQEVTESESEKE